MVIDTSSPIYVHLLSYTLLVVTILTIYSKTPVFKRKYRRNDETINYPHEKITVKVRTVVLITTFIPLLFFMVSENVSIFGNSLLITKFLYGQLIGVALVTFLKKTTGKLRPHFLAVNGIKFDAKDTSFYPDKNSNGQLNEESHATQESRSSFCSAHSAAGGYSAAFLLLHLHNYMVGNALLRPLVMLMVFIVMIFPGLTQYQNYWHDATDIVVGFGLCAAVGCYSYLWML